MTENEVIRELEKIKNDLFSLGYLRNSEKENEIFNIAISTLKEIQQYREIGTLEELTDFKNTKNRLENYHANINVSRLLEYFIETIFENTRHEGFIILTNQEAKDYEAYCSIGTVEEYRAAVEKQKGRKPKEILRHRGGFEVRHCPNCNTDYEVDGRYTITDSYCPKCGKLLDSAFRHYCGNCGQAIDENLEGMEDERD